MSAPLRRKYLKDTLGIFLQKTLTLPFWKYEVFTLKNRSTRYISIYHKIGNIKENYSALGIKAKKDNIFQALKKKDLSA